MFQEQRLLSQDKYISVSSNETGLGTGRSLLVCTDDASSWVAGVTLMNTLTSQCQHDVGEQPQKSYGVHVFCSNQTVQVNMFAGPF